MANKNLCFYLAKLVYNPNGLTEKELLLFRKVLKNLLKRTTLQLSSQLEKELEVEVKNLLEALCGKEETEGCLNDLVSEFLVHLIKKKRSFEHLLGNDKVCYSYVATIARNFLLDRWREKKRRIKTLELSTNSEEEKGDFQAKLKEGEIRTKPLEEEINRLELVELKEIFEREISPDDVKYFCYLLVKDGKKLYACLWGNKSRDAIYKDVSRKKKKVIAFLEKLRDEYGVSFELMEAFVRTILSEKCEQLRSTKVKETED